MGAINLDTCDAVEHRIFSVDLDEEEEDGCGRRPSPLQAHLTLESILPSGSLLIGQGGGLTVAVDRARGRHAPSGSEGLAKWWGVLFMLPLPAEGRVTPAPGLLLAHAMSEARTISDPAMNAKLAKGTEGHRRHRARDDAAAAAILAVAAGLRRARRRSTGSGGVLFAAG